MVSRWVPFSAGRWIVVAILGLPLLWLSLAVSVAGVTDRRHPSQALMWWPWSADAAANLAARLVLRTSTADRTEATELAQRAMKRQAILPVAMRTLAIATVYGNPTSDKPRQLIAYAERLSRRDAPTQLWLIEDSVQRGNVANALIHYDRILRTSLEARAQVLPVLTAAVNDPAIARSLARLLARQPSWRDDFVSQMVTRVDNPVSLATLLPVAGLSPQSPQDRGYLQLGLTRMATQGSPDLAYRLYRRFGGRAPALGQALINGDLAHEPGLAPFDWIGNDDPALATSREMNEGKWQFHAGLSAGATGNLARQMLITRPGRYAIEAGISGPPSDGSTVTLTLRCLNGKTLLSLPSRNGKNIIGTANVPVGCSAAWLTFEGRGALDNGPSDYWIGPVSVRRVTAGS